MSSAQLSVQQRAVLEALKLESPLPTTILYDVPATVWGRTYRIGERVGAVLRRLEKRGLVTGEMVGGRSKEWWISDDGLEALEASRVAAR
jgi:hypothetical protein